jgi:tRNA-guanine family transglycosylase
MDFYVSWYPGDPDYPGYDNDCAMLVSVPSVSREWSLDQFTTPPRRLIIDSGGYRYAIAPQEQLTPTHLFKRQLAILGQTQVEAVLCARDYPILDTSVTSNKKDYCITQTIAYAYEFKQLTKKQRLASHLRTMAIIQGYDEDSLVYCANELKHIGFDLYGIGSMAVLKRHEPIMARVEAVTSVIGADRLHIFGVSVISAARAFRKMGIHSIDSARPAKAAAYNEVLYSNPYRRFGILEPPDVPMAGRIPKHRRLSKPLPCKCPVCKDGKSDILGVGQRPLIRARALHNYYHLKRVFLKD